MSIYRFRLFFLSVLLLAPLRLSVAGVDDTTATDAVHLRDGSIITGTITFLRPDAVGIVDSRTGVRLSLHRSTVKWISFADGRILVPKEGLLVETNGRAVDQRDDSPQISLSIGGSVPLKMRGPGVLSPFSSTISSRSAAAGFTISGELRQPITSWASFVVLMTFNSHALDHSSLRSLRYDGGPDTEGNTGPAFSSRRTMLLWLTPGLSIDIPFSRNIVVHLSGGSGIVGGVFPVLTIIEPGTTHIWEGSPLSVSHVASIGFTINSGIVLSVRYLTARPQYEYSTTLAGSSQQTTTVTKQFKSRTEILEVSLGLILR